MATASRKPAEVFPPGEFLRDELEERGWTQADLAEILERPPRLINEIIAAKRTITPETAKGLADALGTSPEFWMNLESAYQLWHEPAEQGDRVARRARLFGIVPVKEMQRRGWIELGPDIDSFERDVCDFLQIANLDEQPGYAHAARKATDYGSPVTPAQIAWLARARQLAPAARVSRAYSAQSFRGLVASLKPLLETRDQIQHVPRVLEDAGVRFLVIQPLQGSEIDGACFWMNALPAIALSLRFDRFDNFWFVLLHELAHLRNGHGMYLDVDLASSSPGERRPPIELKADSFAAEHLLSRATLEDFIGSERPFYSTQSILAFAQAQRVHPALVIGQLQHRGEITWSSFKKYLVTIRELIVPNALTDGWGVVPPLRI